MSLIQANHIPGLTRWYNEGGKEELETIPGVVPNLLHLPAGCSFSPRCAECGAHCGAAVPELREISPGHLVRCANIPEVRHE